jgi:thiamine biosynthesis lipoprotein
MTAAERESGFALFGSRVRILVGAPRRPGVPSPELAAAKAGSILRGVHRQLSRFEEDSELSLLNADPRELVPVSQSLAAFAVGATEAARRSGGLVDPTILEGLERAGYETSRVDLAPADLSTALRAAPARRPASPDPMQRWREIEVDTVAGTIHRPPGLRIDSGGVAKGLAADLVARALESYSSYCVDCGGDLRVGGVDGLPREVAVPDPFERRSAIRLTAISGAIATSGLGNRIWERSGGFAHHLIDPSTGAPAWTGLVQVTAIARTAAEAETRAKAALLSGPAAARSMLAAEGGIIVHDDGGSELVGPLALTREKAAAA